MEKQLAKMRILDKILSVIKILNGIRETVSYDVSETLMLYDNDKYEEYPFHWHTPAEVIMPTVNDYHVELSSNVHYHLNVGDILIIRPAVLHKIYAAEGERIIFQFSMNILNALDKFDDFFPIGTQAILVTKENSLQIHDKCAELLINIKNEYLGDSPLKDAAVYSMVLEFLVLIGRNVKNSNEVFADVKTSKQKEYIDKFAGITDYIKTHCNEDISLDDIAERSGFSKYHFSRLFREYTGTTYYKYLNRKRIELAELLLLDPDMNITEIAVRSGYNSISSFIRMFRLIENCTPTQYRSMHT